MLLAVADAVMRAGGEVVAIAEHCGARALASFGARLALSHQAKFAQALRLFSGLRRIPYLRGAIVRGASGTGKLESVLIESKGRRVDYECDFLACGFGLVPGLESAALFGCAVADGRVVVDRSQRTSMDGVWAAGESTGIGGVDKALAEGRIAGLAAVGRQPSAADLSALQSAQAFARLLAETFLVPEVMRSSTAKLTPLKRVI